MSEPFDVTSVSDERLLSIVPVEQVEKIVGQKLEWTVAKAFDAIYACPKEHYNDVVLADTHERHKNTPKSKHPLHKFFVEYSESPLLAKKVGYKHNQVLITGQLRRDFAVVVQFGHVFPNSMHLSFIFLANTSIKTSKPMDPGLEHPGLGHGVCETIIKNLTALARECGFDRVSAYAIDPRRQRLFCKRGFTLDTDSDMYQPSQQTGIQIPLKIDLSKPSHSTVME